MDPVTSVFLFSSTRSAAHTCGARRWAPSGIGGRSVSSLDVKYWSNRRVFPDSRTAQERSSSCLCSGTTQTVDINGVLWRQAAVQITLNVKHTQPPRLPSDLRPLDAFVATFSGCGRHVQSGTGSTAPHVSRCWMTAVTKRLFAAISSIN